MNKLDYLNSDVYAAREFLNRYGLESNTFTLANTVLLYEIERVKKELPRNLNVNFVYGEKNWLACSDDTISNLFFKDSNGRVIDLISMGLERPDDFDSTFYDEVTDEFVNCNFSNDEVEYYIKDIFHTIKAKHKANWFESISAGMWFDIRYLELNDIVKGTWTDVNYAISDKKEAEFKPHFLDVLKSKDRFLRWNFVNIGFVLAASVFSLASSLFSFFFAIVWGMHYLATVDIGINEALKHSKTTLVIFLPLIGVLGCMYAAPISSAVFAGVVLSRAFTPNKEFINKLY